MSLTLIGSGGKEREAMEVEEAIQVSNGGPARCRLAAADRLALFPANSMRLIPSSPITSSPWGWKNRDCLR